MDLLMPVIVSLILSVPLVAFIVYLQRKKNEKAPETRVRATVADKRLSAPSTSGITPNRIDGDAVSGTVVFKKENGKLIELRVDGKAFTDIFKGSEGTLTHKGKTFIGFERGT